MMSRGNYFPRTHHDFLRLTRQLFATMALRNNGSAQYWLFATVALRDNDKDLFK